MGRKAPLIQNPPGPTGLLHPSVLTRTRDPSHPFRDSPASGTPRGRQGATGRDWGAPGTPRIPWKGGRCPARPRLVGLSPPFAVACHRPRPRWPGSPLCDKVPSASRQAAPRAPCLTLVGSGFPYEAPPCRAAPFPALGLPLRARPGTARPGVRPRAQEGGLTRPPRGGPSPAAVVDFQPSPGLPSLGTPRARSRDSPPADLTDRLPGSLPGPCPSVS